MTDRQEFHPGGREHVAQLDRLAWLRRILLPLLRPGIVAAFIFSFVTSFDNVVVSIYLIGADTVTLPIRILTYVEWQFDPSIAAISTIFVIVTTVVVVVTEAISSTAARLQPR